MINIKQILVLTLTVLTMNTQASACEHKTSLEEIKRIITEVQSLYFPELNKASIQTREFTSDAYFLQAKPEIKSLLKKHNKRKYFVEINKKLYKCSPSPLALEAIIVHELEHIADYEKMNTLQVIGLGVSYASTKQRAKYERATDLKVVKKGLTAGLIQYREWIYQRINSKELQIKRKYYLTPEEMQDML